MSNDWDWDDETADVKPLKQKKRIIDPKNTKIFVKVNQPKEAPEVEFDEVDDFDDMILEAQQLTDELYGDSNDSSDNFHKVDAKEVEKLVIDPTALFNPQNPDANHLQEQQDLKERYQEFIIQSQSSDLIFGHLPSLDDRVLKKLRTGSEKPTKSIDLHGMTLETAFHNTLSFLHVAYEQGHRLVLVTHGKGKGYGEFSDMGVIKSNIQNWLMGHKKVLAFHTAQPKHGGAGAIYVLLKKNRSGS